MIRLISIVLVLLTFIYATESAAVKGKECAPVKCPGSKPKTCPYGFQKKDGCEICRCNDPCNPPGKPILCGSKQRCYIEKKADGTFEGRCGPPPSTKARKPSKKPKKIDNADCSLPKVTGPCRAAFPRFYYNPATSACESFIYGGCSGNGNNFHTQTECEKICAV